MPNRQVIWATARALGYSIDGRVWRNKSIQQITDPKGNHVAFVNGGAIPEALNNNDISRIAYHLKDKYGVNFTLD